MANTGKIRLNNTVLCGLDYYSASLYDVDMDAFFRVFGLSSPEVFCDFLMTARDMLDMCTHAIMFELPFGRLVIKQYDLPKNTTASTFSVIPTLAQEYDATPECAQVFPARIPEVRFIASGLGLENLRRTGFAVDEKFLDSKFWIESGICLSKFKVTRADFAFDLVDHDAVDGELVRDVCKDFCTMMAAGVGRLSNGKPGGVSYDVVLNDSCSLFYIGKKERTVDGSLGQSNEFLRVYDKKLEAAVKQYHTMDSDAWPDDAEHKGCKSWVRIELQCRYQYAASLLFSLNDERNECDPISKFRNVFRHILTRYSVSADRFSEKFTSLQQIFDGIHDSDFVTNFSFK